jgi:hypothetical protein
MTIHEADSAEKKRTLYLLLGLLIFAAFVAWWFYRWLGQIDALLAGGERAMARHQIDLVFGFAAILLSVCLLSLAILTGKHAREVLRQQRFPSQSARLLRRMTVYEGAPARQRGWLNVALAVFLLIAALLSFPYSLILH